MSDIHLRAAEALANRINDEWERFLESEVRTPAAYPSNRASDMGDPCLRRLVLNRTDGEKAKRYSPGLAAIFRDGDLHEDDVKRVLATRLGIRLQGSQRAFPLNAYNLTGHIDGAHEQMFEGEHVELGAEVKGLNAYDWEALRKNGARIMLEIPRLRRYYFQGQAYMLLKDIKAWVFLVKNKANGQLWAFVMAEDVPVMQEILDRADVVNLHVERGTLPDYVVDRTECKNCKFNGRACFPPDDSPGLAVLQDAGLALLADLVVDNRRAAKDYDRAVATLRDALSVYVPDGKDGERTLALGKALIHMKVKNGRRTMSVASLEVKADGNLDSDEAGG